ncbi:MAG: DNA adenine methylase [Nitrososphaerota archaeon]|jgi:DNA adenine methylase|nr:DNA adenine methylase [Nitrososphaerota archaeon]
MMNNIPTFVKWAGGKKQLLSQFEPYFPMEINRYFEPFVGGGAVAFYIIKQYSPQEVNLSDSNEELVNAYNIIKDDVDSLIGVLGEYKKRHSREFYYKIRALRPNALSRLERAARFIYLNKTCYNGLYRVNAKGQFNVPMGSYKHPAILNEHELKEISRLLQNTSVETKQFYEIEDKAKRGDFVYFDPPYYPISKTSSFTAYTKETFLDQEQERLAKLYTELDRKGVNVMLSNSDSDFIKNLYSGYHINFVLASRMISCDAKGRGKLKELVVTNYLPAHQLQISAYPAPDSSNK